MTNKANAKRRGILEARILSWRDISTDLWVMSIEKPNDFIFKPGQYCTIGFEGIERAYSIASAPHEPYLELFVELVPLPDGMLTPKLRELAPGDTVTIRPRAKGLFIFNPNLPNQLMVSTVTGIVPYISILRDYLYDAREGHYFHILQGASYVEEFVYDNELARLQKGHPDLLTYLPTISRPTEERNSGWKGEVGRVNEILESYVEKHGLAPGETVIYACGHPGMIEDVKSQFIPRGFMVEEERFWKDS